MRNSFDKDGGNFAMGRHSYLVALACFLIIACTALTGARAGQEADPLNSPMWEDMQERFFGDAHYQFDRRIKVQLPAVVEDQAQVPVTVDARGLENVEKIVVFADLNPIQHVLTLTPQDAAAYISFRFKVERATPVRAAAQTSDGVWHVNGAFLDAAGGGCSSPAMARAKPDWALSFGNTKGRAWPQTDGFVRFRMSIKHPMDTGLGKDNVPAFYIETVRVRSQTGKTLATIEMREPVSEDPTITMMVRLPPSETSIQVDSRDTDGNLFSSTIDTRWKESRLHPSAGLE
jgi:sulfur-oxidizing protein SoxY